MQRREGRGSPSMKSLSPVHPRATAKRKSCVAQPRRHPRSSPPLLLSVPPSGSHRGGRRRAYGRCHVLFRHCLRRGLSRRSFTLPLSPETPLPSPKNTVVA